jgi:hypothetical protein
MINPSLDNLYTKIDNHILLAQSYTEISDLAFIMKACRLKPYDYFFKDKIRYITKSGRLYRSWFDEYSNTLKITNKNISIIYNDLMLDKSKIINTDLYYGLSLNQLTKMSKLICLFAGIDEDKQEETIFITFLGIDNYLRSYLYLYQEWQQVSSLLLGMENLKMIAQNREINYFKMLTKKENCPIPCVSFKGWLNCMPMSETLLLDIKNHSELAGRILTIK